jgi:hypothetical protein
VSVLAEEFLPFEQFIAGMKDVESACLNMEAYNADVLLLWKRICSGR